MIVRLELLTPELKANYLLNYKKMFKEMSGMELRDPWKGFDENGLRYPQEYLQAVGRSVIFEPLEMMATYANYKTIKTVDINDKRFSQSIINANGIPPNPQYINAVSIGNLAYVTLNHQDATVRAAAESILDVIFASEKRSLEGIKA